MELRKNSEGEEGVKKNEDGVSSGGQERNNNDERRGNE